MDKFAKLFEFDDIGQVVCLLTTGDNGPEILVHFQPEGLGVCTQRFSYEDGDEDEQWERADSGFALLDRERVYEMTKPIIDKFSGILDGSAQ